MIDKKNFAFIFYASVDRELMFRRPQYALHRILLEITRLQIYLPATPSLTLSLLKLCQSVRLSHVGHTSARKFARGVFSAWQLTYCLAADKHYALHKNLASYLGNITSYFFVNEFYGWS